MWHVVSDMNSPVALSDKSGQDILKLTLTYALYRRYRDP